MKGASFHVSEAMFGADRLTAMDRSPERSDRIQAVTEAWQAQTLNTVLWLTLLVGFLRVWMVTFQWPKPFSPWMRLSTAVLYLGTVAIAVGHRAKTRHRVWAFLLILYAVAALQLYRAGMAGSGRITLVAIPLYALLFAGYRSGWTALFLAAILYSAFIGLWAWVPAGEHLEIRENPADPDFWIMQGILLLGAAVLLLVLLSRFWALHIRAVREQRRLEEEITRASEEERRRLGSELHDGLCQQLTAALLQCVALENQQAVADGRTVGVGPPPLPGQPLQNQSSAAPPTSPLCVLRQLLEDAIGTAHEVARGLCPLDLGADSLGPALERLVRRTQEAAGLECEYQEQGATSIGDQQTALHLYRIAQEAVGNAAKHGHTRRILIALHGTPDSLILQVEDDGCGIPAVQSKSGGMGMNIMAYRARILGGTLGVEAVPGGGTRIVCRVPRGRQGDGGQRRGAGPQDDSRSSSTLQENDPHAQ